jgi:hypothetical protein
MPRRHRFIIASTALALLANAASHADVYKFRIVAESGDPAPGSLGGEFLWFSAVSLNASGQVAFRADTDGAIAESGYWKTAFNNPQSIQLIVGQDYPVPNSGGQHFGTFSSSYYAPHLNDAGNVGFSAPVGDMVINTGVFRMVNGVIETLAIPGQQVPGLAAGVTYEWILNLHAFNDDDLLATRVQFSGPGVNASNNSGLVQTWFGGFQLVAREGGGAPGLPGTTFGDFGETMPLLADNGQIAFDVGLNGASAGDSSRWRGWPAAFANLVKEGDLTPVGGTFGGSTPDFWTMSLTTNGAAFVESIEGLAGSTRALWVDAGGANGQVLAVALQGDPAPVGIYDLISKIDIDTASDGTTVFVARVAGPGITATKNTLLLRAKLGEATEVLLREGTAAYGFGAGVEIDELFDLSTYPSFANNDSGWTLIQARVRGLGINNTNNIGVWTIDPQGEIHFIARTGMLLSLAGEPARSVESLRPTFGVGPQSGRRSSINAIGDVGLSIDFTNGDSVVVVAQLPEACPGDLNGDGSVDALDLAILLGAWGTFGPVGTGGDVDRDGDSDASDLGTLLGGWGPCPL